MTRAISKLPSVICIALSSLFAIGASQSCLAATVTVSPTDNIEALVKANPPGTEFLLQAGMYYNQNITPLEGDSFVGKGLVKFVGSVVLTFEKDPAGTGLWVASATPNNNQHGTCQHIHPLCAYPQDLFYDNIVQTPVSSPTGMPAWSWYFDRKLGKVYLPADPGVHIIELSMLPYAFSGTASNVSISNITVERYANLAQFGAIGGAKSGPNWVVDNVEVRFNHGVGVKLGSGSSITNSFVHHNGELGIGLSGTNSKAIGNEISFNNYAGFGLGWEAGGSKFSNTTNLLLQSNNVHDNLGAGLWADTDNKGTIYENNTITNNQSSGIQHELSFSAIIRNNVVSGNGAAPADNWMWDGQISIQNSANVEVYGNTVEVPTTGANGIAIVNQKRGSGPMGPWVSQNNSIYENTIIYDSADGSTGMVNDTGSHPTLGNSFSANNYICKVPGDNAHHWWWFSKMSFAQWQTVGQDQKGVVTVPKASLTATK